MTPERANQGTNTTMDLNLALLRAGKADRAVRHREVEALYRRHSRLVYRRARELLGSDDAATDATQEVFVRVLQTGGVVPSEPTPTAWLYRVATNLCLNRLRDRSRRAVLLAEKQALPAGVPPTAEARVIVASILRHVPPEIQETAIYFFLDEMTYDEIARVTGVARRTVGNRLAAFREMTQVGRSDAEALRVA